MDFQEDSKVNRTAFIIPVLVILAQTVCARQYPTLRSVQVFGEVTIDQTSHTYNYNYTISNGVSSAGSIMKFEIDIRRSVNTQELDTVGLRFKNQFVEGYFRDDYATLVGLIVPVGFPNSPGIWMGGLTTDLTAIFWGDSRLLVGPNQRLSGFTMMSKGLPSIRWFKCSPRFDVDSLFPDIEDSLNTLTTGQMDSIREATNYWGITIGPGAPPATFAPSKFLDTINSDVVRSRSFNWISSQPIADKYSELFNRIRGDITALNTQLALIRIDTILQQATLDSSSTLSSEAYALIRYNTEYLRDNLNPTGDVRGGMFMPNSGILSVKAKPSVAFGATDTIKGIVATVRWLAMYNIILGTATGSYGFSKYDSVVTVGSYRYQKFKTTTSQTLSWAAGSEYELFTIPGIGLCGAETFELTNALPGGEWFVDINYTDKTDSVFYQPIAQGFAFQNKSAGSGATAYTGERHAAIHGTKFHEVYESAGEIIYRRKDLNSATWDTTTRISSGNGSNNDASIVVAHDGSVHVVWQRQLNANAFALWYNKSTDGGITWGTPIRPASAESVVIIQQNQWNIYPLISELGTSQLVVVVCSSVGPCFMKSTNSGEAGLH